MIQDNSPASTRPAMPYRLEAHEMRRGRRGGGAGGGGGEGGGGGVPQKARFRVLGGWGNPQHVTIVQQSLERWT